MVSLFSPVHTSVQRRTLPLPTELRSAAFRHSSTAQQDGGKGDRPRSSHGVFTPGIEADIRALLHASNRSKALSAAGRTSYRASTVGPEGRSTTLRRSTQSAERSRPSHAPLSPTSSRTPASPSSHPLRATHGVQSRPLSPTTSHRLLQTDAMQDPRLPLRDVSPASSSPGSLSHSPLSKKVPKSRQKDSPSTKKKDRFGAMLTQSRSRSLSIASLKTVVCLEECYAKYVKYEKEMRELVAGVNSEEINPGEAKTRLALLESELGKLQGNGIDSLNTTHLVSGQDACKKLRRELTLKAERMQNYIETVFPMLNARVSIYYMNLEALNKGNVTRS